MQYTIIRDQQTQNALSVFVALDGRAPLVVTKGQKQFDLIVSALDADDEQTVRDFLDPVDAINSAFGNLGRIFQNSALRLTGAEEVAKNLRVTRAGVVLYAGEPVEKVLSDTVLRYWRESDSVMFAPLVRFISKVMNNPNVHSKEHLYRWLANQSFVIAEDGDLLGYKYIREDGLSVAVGAEPVTVNGEVFEGRIPNPIGGVVSMDRELVTFDPDNTCSVGLHVGAWEYVSGRSNIVLVKLNPENVVSVPNDHNGQKLRTCRYEVVAHVTGPVKQREVPNFIPFVAREQEVVPGRRSEPEADEVAADVEVWDCDECGTTTDRETYDSTGGYCDACQFDLWASDFDSDESEEDEDKWDAETDIDLSDEDEDDGFEPADEERQLRDPEVVASDTECGGGCGEYLLTYEVAQGQLFCLTCREALS